MPNLSARAPLPVRRTPEPVSTCIGCGCTDHRACVDGRGHACWWLVRDRKRRVGVCSACPGQLQRWDRGDRSIAHRTGANHG